MDNMKQIDSFNRLTIDDMKALKEHSEMKALVKKALSHLEEEITTEAEKLAQELVDQGHDPDSFEIEANQRWDVDKLIVDLKVVQGGKTLVFDLFE